MPKQFLTQLTFGVGGITYSVQGKYNTGKSTNKFGQDGGLPMVLDIPVDADYRKLVVEFSEDAKFCRSIVLYNANYNVISRADMKQDDEDPDSRYYTMEFVAGEKIVGMYGHEAKELFINGCIHCFGFYTMRPEDPDKPWKTQAISKEEFQGNVTKPSVRPSS